MCPPPDPVARDAAPRGDSPARGHVPPPPGVGPRSESNAERIAAPDRTVVTRRPRSDRAAEPHELLPTLRLPPVEARALRRQVSAEAGPDAPLPIDSAEIAVVDAGATVAPTTSVRAMPGPPRLHRPPLPMPDVLRQGPRPAPRRGLEEPVEAAAPSTPVPTPVTTIDTASLVLEVAECLAATPHRATPPDAGAIDAAAARERSAGPAAPELPAPERAAFQSVAIDRAPIDPVAIDPAAVRPAASERTALALEPAAALRTDRPLPLPGARARRRRTPWLAGVAAVAASLAAALWAVAPDPQAASAGLGALRERVQAVETSPAPAVAPPPAAIAVPVAPPPAEPMPAAVAPDVPAPPLPAVALATPTPAAEPDEPDEVTVVEPDPPASPAPAAKSTPKSKSKAKSKRRKAKPAPTKPSTKVAAPAPALDATALLREAEKAFAEGRYGTALRNAQRSLAARSDPRAARIVVLSACKLGREDVARTNFERLPLGQRRGVRNTCKDAGVRVGS